MSSASYYMVAALLALCTTFLSAQTTVNGKIFDRLSKEPLVGATVLADDEAKTITDANGGFTLQTSAKTLKVSYIGFVTEVFKVAPALNIALAHNEASLQTVVVTASREAQRRSEAPMAIARLSPALINETKPTLIAELLNKTPGVLMTNLNNEQHGMSIRQPMGLSAYFLYMEDGLPLRPMGVFNHNALIEMNIFGVSSVEVVKGPISSLYGPEAVGGAVNFITHRPTAVPTARVGVQVDQWGYQRLQFGTGATFGRVGYYLSGFTARQREGWQSRSDYDKLSLNARVEYAMSKRTQLTFTGSLNDYDSQTGGSVDSTAFYQRNYPSAADFTYRKVKAWRARLSLEHAWNDRHQTTLHTYFRDNSIGQNPSYGIRWRTGDTTATGEVNENSFTSYGTVLQHRFLLPFWKTKVIAGAMYDFSPTHYWAYRLDLKARLRPDRRSVETYELLRERPDVRLQEYQADLHNAAGYVQLETSPLPKLRLTLGLRYDRMAFDYRNNIDNSTGSLGYAQTTPKIGATYELTPNTGVYANYSQGFSPPNLTAIFRRRPGPAGAPAEFYYNLKPAQFSNYEVGGWASLWRNKAWIDVALYRMDGRNELLNIRQPDNSTDFQSAGKTLHTGVEYSLTLKLTPAWFFRFGGTNALHRFEEFLLSTRAADAVKDVNGKMMPQAPTWIANTELTYRPPFFKGFRLSAEWQRVSEWYQNQVNTVKYDDRSLFGARGISLLNVRAGYEWRFAEVFANLLNATDELYANNVTRGNAPTDRATFTPAAPRTLVVGLQINLSGNK
jgi:iron complex outermembrane recepter protein